MADIATGMQGLLQSLQPSPTNFTDQTTLQNQNVQQNDILLANQQRQQKAADATNALYMKTLGTVLNSDPKSLEYKQGILGLSYLNPALHDSVKTGLDTMSEDAKNQHLQDITAFHGHVTNGNYDDALDLQRSIMEADQRAGKDITADQQVFNLTKAAAAGDKGAISKLNMLSGLNYANAIGPDKYAELEKLPSDIANTEANTAKTNVEASTLIPAQANAANAEADKNTRGTVQQYTDPQTDEIKFFNDNPNAPQPPIVTKDNSVAANSIQQSTDAILGTETNAGQSDSVKNPNSSATGRGQFLDGTWKGIIKQDFPELAKGKSESEILALRKNPELAKAVANEYNKQNVYGLYNAGISPNNTAAAVAYKTGLGGGGVGTKGAGAIEILKADPSTPLNKIISPDKIAANKQTMTDNGKPITVGQYLDNVKQTLVNNGADPNQQIAVADRVNGTGSLYLNALPRGRAEVVKKVINGELPAPVGRAGLADDKALMQDVIKADPTFKATRYQALADMNNPETKQGAALVNLNTMSKHFAKIAQLAYQLNQENPGFLNVFSHAASGLTGGKTSSLVQQFKHEVNTASQEQQQFYGKETIPADENIKNIFSPEKKSSDLLIAAKQAVNNAYDRLGSYNAAFKQQAGMDIPYERLIDPDALKAKRTVDYYAGLVDPTTNNLKSPSNNDISYLLKNKDPATINHFNAVYGPGTAQQVLKDNQYQPIISN